MLQSYKCVVCGYIAVAVTPPKTCAVCGASADAFEVFKEVISDNKESSNSWKCIVCGYIHEGSTPPEVCPICGVKKDMFEPIYKTAIGNISEAEMNVVIIGSGIAGLTAADEIRGHCNKAHITIISEEKQLPYYRLSLTRYLEKEIDEDKLIIHSNSWYDKKRINLHLGKEVTEIDRAKRRLS